MILFNAGLITSNFNRHGGVYSRLSDDERVMRDSNEYFLESYHYVGKESAVKKMRKDGVKVFLDSGAYSALTQNKEIDIGAYCDYVYANTDIIMQYATLDAIGDHKKSYWNQVEMERRGLRPMPCYHAGEPIEVLEHYVANYDYISVGGLVGGSVKALKEFLDNIWEKVLCNADGTAKIKVHGFGITSLPLMMRYPWYSVDSSTWVQWAANGLILLPHRGQQLNISSKSSSRKLQGQHIDSIREIERDAVEEEIRRDGGDPVRLRDLYYSRWAWNVWAFPKYAKLHDSEHRTFKPEFTGLF